MSVYGTLGNDPLDSPDPLFFVSGHNVAIPASMGHFGGSTNTPGSLSAIHPISQHLLNEDRTYEALTTIGGEQAPDDMVEELTGTSFISTSYIKHNQYLNISPRPDATLFVVNPNRLLDPSGSADRPQGPLRCRELASPGTPRGGHLDAFWAPDVGSKVELESTDRYEPCSDERVDECPPQDPDTDQSFRENEARSCTDRALAETTAGEQEER